MKYDSFHKWMYVYTEVKFNAFIIYCHLIANFSFVLFAGGFF